MNGNHKLDALFLVRHGETEWSLAGRHTGSTDLPLTEAGERRASQLRGPLSRIQFSQVLTSPRQRARLTCERAGLGAAAVVNPDLQEWDYGDYEGRTTADIRAQRPGWNVFLHGCPNGESVDQVSARADRLLGVLRSAEGTIALFSHAHFLRALAARWVGLPVQEGRHLALSTASLSILTHDQPNAETPVISLWNAGPDTAQA